MTSSRIFVKSLPPTYTQDEFKKHFSQSGKRDVTDVKLFPQRRIGYVGYRTPGEAQKAVKYFNKTFIRMSRIGVEIATPIEETDVFKGKSRAPTRPPLNNEGQAASVAERPLKRKRSSADEQEQETKLKEFLAVMKPKAKKKAWESIATEGEAETASADLEQPVIVEDESDNEYERLVPVKKQLPENSTTSHRSTDVGVSIPGSEDVPLPDSNDVSSRPPVSDADWARSRTSRLLGLLDDDEEEEEEEAAAAAAAAAAGNESASASQNVSVDHEVKNKGQEQENTIQNASGIAPSVPTPPLNDHSESMQAADTDLEPTPSTMRLFVRNLPYDVKADDLEAEFAIYENLENIHVPLDSKSGLAKGFAFIQYSNAESAEQALAERDGQIFQGRLIHVLPSAAPRNSKLDDFELSKLPLKKQQEIKKKRESEIKTFNWNALYMNSDAVVASVADRLGLSKSEVLDPTSSNAAVRQAHAETHVIQETKNYFKQQGIDLDSFKRSVRGDTAILIKNIPYDFGRDELRRILDDQGDVKRFAMPPSGNIAIVEYSNAAQCTKAWRTLAYRRVKNTVLLLEKAPVNVFASSASDDSIHANAIDSVSKVSTNELKDALQTVSESTGTATLFVRNLNFSTSNELLTNAFQPFEGFLSARVKTKTDPKKPGQILSMGFGFLEFSTAAQAQTVLQVMDGHVLEGHKLQIRASHKGMDAAEERKRADAQKKAAAQKTKVIIKNLPFEVTKKDIQALFGAYGQLRSVRVPRKIDKSTRGFAFADFMTSKEAQNAMEALRDTHLLGRRLVLDFAAEDATDAEAEIERMQQKVGAQVNKVAIQKLTSNGRKKFTTQGDEDAA